MNIPRAEYPRPQFMRKEFLNLNGEWSFSFDDQDKGLSEKWFEKRVLDRAITVPFPFQSELSGIGEGDFHDIVWYERKFNIPEKWNDRRIIVHFGAVDYRSTVWVNGIFVTSHEGGHTPFHSEITYALQKSENQIIVRVEDLSTDLEQPRGKQYWKEKPRSVFYTRTTGIWQTVWLEPVGQSYLEKVKLTPDIDRGELMLDYTVSNGIREQEIEIDIFYDGERIVKDRRYLEPSTVKVPRRISPKEITEGSVSIVLKDFSEGKGRLWSPEDPNLYDIVIRLKENHLPIDEVKSYFGMRKVSVENGKVMLNNKPYYMKLVLDQGYFPQGLLTAPSDDDLRKDIELTKEMGFNGVRKHQKVEDPRYFYWADQLGLLVWGEMANCRVFSDKASSRMTAEWQEAVERDYNHPSIVAWVPINESWGVPSIKSDMRQVAHSLSLYYLTRSLDSTRLIISNDGWEHTKSDLCTIHDYESQKEVLENRYSSSAIALQFKPSISKRSVYAPGFEYQGEPFIISECGGIAYKKSDWEGWGYTAASNDVDFVDRYEKVISALLESPLVQGFCYTQITDVEQEINGLLTYDRKPKVDLHLIRKINEGKT